jgi:chemotaxis protein methyltransferase CheR
VFDFFYENCLLKLVEEKRISKHRLIRIWSAGCSFGEEPYSLAILLDQALGSQHNFLAKIWATDIDEEALAIAQKGEYGASALKNVSRLLRQKYFTYISDDRWRINDTIKKMVFFKRHNVFYDVPLRAVDVIFCRNVRIYFNPSEMEKFLLTLFRGLRVGGYLVMGMVETIPSRLKELFVPIHGSYKIYQKIKA